jgi:site-specific DNA-methyltransferase (adenine-specific)
MKLTNEIIEGDCIQVMKKLPNKTFDILFTDSPYWVLNKKDITFDNRKPLKLSDEFDTVFKNYNEYYLFMKEVIKTAIPKMKDVSRIATFYAFQYIGDLMRMVYPYGYVLEGIWTWHKTNPAPKIYKRNFISSCEYLASFKRGVPTFNFKGQTEMHNYFEYPDLNYEVMPLDKVINYPLTPQSEKIFDKENNAVHIAQKPETVLKHLLEIFTNTYEYVLEPFAGVGSTNKVCLDMTRNCIGIEKNPKYFFYANKRLETAKKAIINPNALQKTIAYYAKKKE